MCIEFFELYGAAFLIVIPIMTLCWMVSYLKNNAGIVDIGWAVSFVLISWAFALLGEGYWLKRWLMTLMVTIWGSRLAWSLWNRFNIDREDPRYTDLRVQYGENLLNFKLYLMFLFQGILILLLALPFVLVSGYANHTWHWSEGIGLLLWLGGVYGESLADHQLMIFKERSSNHHKKVCDVGLWRYSRHPNYFFEWIVWIGYFLFAFSSPGGWFAISAPMVMFILLVFVSGIPLAEAQALRSKGDAYREYQRQVSSFIPWPF